jgi:cytidine deaminase
MAIFQFEYEQFSSSDDLQIVWQQLIHDARAVTKKAIAPYSKFNVGCAVLLSNGKIVTGFNIENASYPVTICAERTTLSAVLTQYPLEAIEAIAISYNTFAGNTAKPLSPCGLCRQFMSEVEDIQKKKIPLILSGMQGEVMVVHSVKDLLPFTFGGGDLK